MGKERNERSLGSGRSEGGHLGAMTVMTCQSTSIEVITVRAWRQWTRSLRGRDG
jgi:hypothetical protein